MNKVLVVEDHADIRRLIHLTLEFEDWTVHEATTARIGLAAAAQLQPDLILADVMMPGDLSGLDMCRELKRQPGTSHIPVVILSACGQQADRDRGIAAGAEAYLAKPFSPLQLIELIDQLVHRRKEAAV
ncbi:response regulator [Ideonella sp. DXS29W]|uniref:Response regulator n=1 Tax=Ideonella lacteola TaxID=2984193 RepID=A0ABU9BXU9_9BURK